MTLSPEALAKRAALDAEVAARRRDILDGRRPMVQGARTLGSLALATVGCAVWTDPIRRRNSHDESLGGIVLEVLAAEHPDRETGEIIVQRAFRCYDPIVTRDRAFRTFPEADIPQAGVEAVDTAQLRNAVRRFARWVADSKGPFVSDTERLLAYAHRLAIVTLGGPL